MDAGVPHGGQGEHAIDHIIVPAQPHSQSPCQANPIALLLEHAPPRDPRRDSCRNKGDHAPPKIMLHSRGDVALTDEQSRQLAIVTRTASTLSALGVITIITTFCLSQHFRNPMHRLIFINAFYNAFDIMCTMISVSGPEGGDDSALCQFQGFLNQM